VTGVSVERLLVVLFTNWGDGAGVVSGCGCTGMVDRFLVYLGCCA